MNRVVVLLGLLQVYAVPVSGAPSALIQIPTTDVVEPGQGWIDVASALSAEGALTCRTGLSRATSESPEVWSWASTHRSIR